MSHSPPVRVVRLYGIPCGECGAAAHAMTLFADHTTTTHEAVCASYCVTIGAQAERRRRIREES